MHRPAILCLASLLVAGPVAVAAGQAAPPTDCGGLTGRTARRCTAALDAAAALQPTVGLLLGGGNPVVGAVRGQGGFGHFGLFGRVTIVSVTIPDPAYDGATDTVGAAKRFLVPAPRLDATLGIASKTLPQGRVTVDLLGSVAGFPAFLTSRVRVDDNARRIAGVALGFGYGVRLGFAGRDSVLPIPPISLSVTRRDFPTLWYGDLGAGHTYRIGLKVSATNVRLMVGKSLAPLSVAAGGGIDLYGGSAHLVVRDSATGGPTTPIVAPLTASRIVVVVNPALELLVLRAGGEIGFQVGKNPGIATVFEKNDPAAGRFFGGVSVGLRF